MKIDNSIRTLNDSSLGDSRLRLQSVAGRVRGGGNNSDSVELSAASIHLQSPADNLASSGVFDSEKVREIKIAMAQGSLEVDPGRIADGLLSMVQDLLQASTS